MLAELDLPLIGSSLPPARSAVSSNLLDSAMFVSGRISCTSASISVGSPLGSRCSQFHCATMRAARLATVPSVWLPRASARRTSRSRTVRIVSKDKRPVLASAGDFPSGYLSRRPRAPVPRAAFSCATAPVAAAADSLSTGQHCRTDNPLRCRASTGTSYQQADPRIERGDSGGFNVGTHSHRNHNRR